LPFASRVFAAPPFLTDDPEPTDYRHWEAYFFTSGDRSSKGYAVDGPAAELDYGAFPDTQLTLIVDMATAGGDGMRAASGFGDVLFSAKYRFVHETSDCPEIAFFPAVTFPTGDAARGLGNGRASFQLPLWAQKSFDSWTTYGGGGVSLNSAPGQRDFPFGGWLLQRGFGKQLTLGGELFAQGRDADDDKGFVAPDFGGSYAFTEHFSMLASLGHSIVGDRHLLWYFGLYGTW
jgi:Putative MetA-pathway of phenol degradation